jgi:hypothetical protein
MKKQYIRSEEEKEKKRGQLEKSRRRKYPHQTNEVSFFSTEFLFLISFDSFRLYLLCKLNVQVIQRR